MKLKKEKVAIYIFCLLILALVSFFIYEQKIQNDRSYEIRKSELEFKKQKAFADCVLKRSKNLCEELYK